MKILSQQALDKYREYLKDYSQDIAALLSVDHAWDIYKQPALADKCYRLWRNMHNRLCDVRVIPDAVSAPNWQISLILKVKRTISDENMRSWTRKLPNGTLVIYERSERQFKTVVGDKLTLVEAGEFFRQFPAAVDVIDMANTYNDNYTWTAEMVTDQLIECQKGQNFDIYHFTDLLEWMQNNWYTVPEL